jgi:hypothetical protein
LSLLLESDLERDGFELHSYSSPFCIPIILLGGSQKQSGKCLH